MDNNYNIDNRSQIIQSQSDYMQQKILEQLRGAKSPIEVNAIIAKAIQDFYVNLGRPLMTPRYAESHHLPFIEEHNQTNEEIFADVSILYAEMQGIAKVLSDQFNYAQSERLRIDSSVKGVSSLVNDLNLIANSTTPNSMYFTDSFTDQKKMEPAMIMGTPAQIASQEGIVTLGRTEAMNQSAAGSIKMLQGNGEKGTYHIAKRVTASTQDGQLPVTAAYISDQTPNDNPDAILDGRPDTIFEYQMINFREDAKTQITKGYDVDWAKGTQVNDRLRLKVVVELQEVATINWIDINPYNPSGSTGKVTVYSIRTSEDGFDYKPLYEGGDYILNAQLNSTPQTYRVDDIFNGSNDYNAAKFAGQGVWSFPTRKARYVEVVLDQPESYSELVGHTYYQRFVNGSAGVRIPASSAPENVVKGAPARYALNSQDYLDKNIEILDGWRYAIGLRDINIMSYQFAEKSEFYSTRYTSEKAIKEVILYANEKIPAPFLSKVAQANDWIQYFVSFDDVNWTRISPMHQQPVNPEEFAPKIIEINGRNTDLQESLKLYKGYVASDQAVHGVRLKVVIQRPTDIADAASFTPILEDYSIRVVFEDQN